MLAEQAAHDEETEPETRNLTLYVPAGTVEASKDPAQLVSRDSNAPIRNFHTNPSVVALFDSDPNPHGLFRIFDRVLEEIAEYESEFVGVPADA